MTSQVKNIFVLGNVGHWCSDKSVTKITGKKCVKQTLESALASILFPYYDLKHMNTPKSEERLPNSGSSEEHLNAS